MSNTVLKIENINKRFSEYFSLKNINLELNKGEVHAIIGENGSGKSSIMNIICGLCSRDSGNVYIDEQLVNINSQADAKKLGIAMIHQESSLFEHFTIAENIFIDNKPYVNEKLKIIDFSKMYHACNELFNKLGVNINSKTLVKYLNPAHKQIVEIAKAYMSKAKIIIMDEPTSSLSENETSILMSIIEEFKSSGISVFYISHKLEEIKKICDSISVIRNGEIVGTEYIKDMDVNNIFNMMTGFYFKERYPKIKFKLEKEVLKVSNLSSGDFLKDINISLRKKEIIGITGLIGAGGTRLAESIFGINKMDSGEIIINGSVKKINSPTDAIKFGIAYVTEDRSSGGIFPYLNTYKNISSASMARVTNKLLINEKYEKEIAASYVDKLGIKIGTINDEVAYLSGGNQQKVVLAKWLMSKSKIFIFDEPTKGIDVPSKVDVYNLMNELLQKGAAIIVISSHLDELMGMCDKIVVLLDGKIVDTIPRENFSTKKIMQLATQGKDHSI